MEYYYFARGLGLHRYPNRYDQGFECFKLIKEDLPSMIFIMYRYFLERYIPIRVKTFKPFSVLIRLNIILCLAHRLSKVYPELLAAETAMPVISQTEEFDWSEDEVTASGWPVQKSALQKLYDMPKTTFLDQFSGNRNRHLVERGFFKQGHNDAKQRKTQLVQDRK